MVVQIFSEVVRSIKGLRITGVAYYIGWFWISLLAEHGSKPASVSFKKVYNNVNIFLSFIVDSHCILFLNVFN